METLLIDLGLQAVGLVIGAFTKANAPQQVLTALQAAYDAVLAHKNDTITKAALEANRG